MEGHQRVVVQLRRQAEATVGAGYCRDQVAAAPEAAVTQIQSLRDRRQGDLGLGEGLVVGAQYHPGQVLARGQCKVKTLRRLDAAEFLRDCRQVAFRLDPNVVAGERYRRCEAVGAVGSLGRVEAEPALGAIAADIAQDRLEGVDRLDP